MKNTIEDLINYIYIYGLTDKIRPQYLKVIAEITEDLTTSCKKTKDQPRIINKKLVETLGAYDTLNSLFYISIYHELLRKKLINKDIDFFELI